VGPDVARLGVDAEYRSERASGTVSAPSVKYICS
jgi:hypothetical protein